MLEIKLQKYIFWQIMTTFLEANVPLLGREPPCVCDDPRTEKEIICGK